MKNEGSVVYVLSLDRFYYGIPRDSEGKCMIEPSEYNFDTPDAIDMTSLIEVITAMKKQEVVKVPNYSFVNHCVESYEMVEACDIVIVEGIFAMYACDYYTKLQNVGIGYDNLFNMRIYIELSPDVSLVRRIRRDIKERGRDALSVIEQYERFVKEGYEKYVKPYSNRADVIVPNDRDNTNVAVECIVSWCKQQRSNYRDTN
jgi:uridine kinase